MPGIEVEFVEGMNVDNGHFSQYLIQDTERMETVFEDPAILLTSYPITSATRSCRRSTRS